MAKKRAATKAARDLADVEIDEEEPVKAGAGEAMVLRHFLAGGRLIGEEIEDYDDDEVPLIRVRKFKGPHARVGLSLFQQWNLGQDNLVATQIMISVPCYREEVEDAYAWADRWATQKLQDEDEKIQQKLGRGSKKPRGSD